MNSQFFYPTASGSLGEARRLGFREILVKRELETPPSYSAGQQFENAVQSNPTSLIAEENDDRLYSDYRDAPTTEQ